MPAISPVKRRSSISPVKDSPSAATPRAHPDASVRLAAKDSIVAPSPRFDRKSQTTVPAPKQQQNRVLFEQKSYGPAPSSTYYQLSVEEVLGNNSKGQVLTDTAKDMVEGLVILREWPRMRMSNQKSSFHLADPVQTRVEWEEFGVARDLKSKILFVFGQQVLDKITELTGNTNGVLSQSNDTKK